MAGRGERRGGRGRDASTMAKRAVPIGPGSTPRRMSGAKPMKF